MVRFTITVDDQATGRNGWMSMRLEDRFSGEAMA